MQYILETGSFKYVMIKEGEKILRFTSNIDEATMFPHATLDEIAAEYSLLRFLHSRDCLMFVIRQEYV